MTRLHSTNGVEYPGMPERRNKARRHSDSGHTMRELGTALKVCPMPLLLVDPSGRIAMANGPLEQLFEYGPGALTDALVECLVPDDISKGHPRLRETFLKTPVKRAMGRGRDLNGVTRTGRIIPLELGLDPVVIGGEHYALVAALDISERKAMEAEREEKNRELELLNTELSSFANSASHDLKAPLSSITGLLCICLEDLEDADIEEARRNLERAMEISRRSADKVENVLAIARAGRDSIPVEAFAIRAEIAAIWRDLTAAMTSPPELRLDLRHGDPVLTERPTFNMIMDNLLSNAIRYADAGKANNYIRISSAVEGGQLRMTVADNGLGIAAEHLPRVFRMFERLDERSGDGMGLSLVRKQIERLKGEISAESREGAGSAFTFVLPLAQEGSA